MVYPTLLPLMRTPQLPVVDCTDATADLNGLVRFAERRILVTARVPSRVNWLLLRQILNEPEAVKRSSIPPNHTSVI